MHEFHYDVRSVQDHVAVNAPHDIGVVHAGQRVGFGSKELHYGGVAPHGLVQDLDGHLAVEAIVLPEVDVCHSASTQEALDSDLADGAADPSLVDDGAQSSELLRSRPPACSSRGRRARGSRSSVRPVVTARSNKTGLLNIT